MPKFSIITINYNNKIGLLRTIESVLSQSYTNYEYIVIDGGSLDGSKEVIESFAHRLDYWISEPDRGIYNAMNKGVEQAHGEYLLFLNSGDVLHDINVLKNIEHECINADLIIGRVLNLNTQELSSMPDHLTMNLFYIKSIPHPATFINNKLFTNRRYDESYRIVSDWKFFIETIVIENATCKNSMVVVSDFDTNGVSSINKRLVEEERNHVLNSLFPVRVLDDYITLNNGQGYKACDYDRFFITLRPYRMSYFIYLMAVLCVKFIAIFRPGLAFVKNYPTFPRRGL